VEPELELDKVGRWKSFTNRILTRPSRSCRRGSSKDVSVDLELETAQVGR